LYIFGPFGFISGFFILFHWSSYLVLYQYHAVFIDMALQYSLKSDIVKPPALLLLLTIALAIQSFVLPNEF
jgi:hypothetical protein